ncbi:hypothetical protein PITCH_A640024 [uncultured Desulfobacterium sp.]|uniref:Uncharacterized protein n=1 Tax=uncultured Desulfobacterium sp. TaxID=201089 RepID=A0A445N1B0_9BACT|nr:hypothetical protein PITCH_A640024 [uncultured Desulfobacterium sp.]
MTSAILYTLRTPTLTFQKQDILSYIYWTGFNTNSYPACQVRVVNFTQKDILFISYFNWKIFLPYYKKSSHEIIKSNVNKFSFLLPLTNKNS